MSGMPVASRDSGGGDASSRIASRLWAALGVTLALVLFEGLAGFAANSMALLTDAVHNVTDVVALGLSLYAVQLKQHPANSRQTYGYHRVGILVALANSVTLMVVAVGLFYEAYRRFLDPPHVDSRILTAVGVLAVVVNLATALLVRKGSDGDLNLRSTFLHLMSDVLSTVGVVVAGILILSTGANWLDPLVGALIGCLIIYSAWTIMSETVEILLESTPRDINLQVMVKDMQQIKGVLGVHDLHVWSLAPKVRAMSAHVLTDDIPIRAANEIQTAVSSLVAHQYNIAHATLQVECADCDAGGLYCDITGADSGGRA